MSEPHVPEKAPADESKQPAPAALLFDLGNVLLRIEFSRVFEFWAHAAGRPVGEVAERWTFDDAYEQHEIGAITFAEYRAHLRKKLLLELAEPQWLAGWNSLFVGPIQPIVRRLPALAARYRLMGFTNTNAAHAEYWRHHFARRAGLQHLAPLFVSSEIGKRKPDHAAFRHVGEVAELPLADILFLDDHAPNIAAAKVVGLQTWHVTDVHDTADMLDDLLIHAHERGHS